KMAMGGIYDQLGGGFARYSTDSFWKAPHFEKMLYDNGQLMSLYANAYKCDPKEIYKDVVYGIYKFVSEKLTSPDGGFCCAMDADSEGIEGEYYIWKKEELEELLGTDFALFSAYYSINEKDVWEDDKYILQRKQTDTMYCDEQNISLNDLLSKKKNWHAVLNERREKRIAPALDDKILASWNGLMLKGLADAHKSFKEPVFLDMAINNANFIKNKLITADGGLWHGFKNDKGYIEGFLDDYAFIASGFISLYEATFNESWLNTAKSLTEYAIEHFYDARKNIFYYTHGKQESIIVRKAEITDNVIPASNSEMAIVLYKLGHMLSDDKFIEISEGMLVAVKENMQGYPQGYTNWAILLLHNQIRFCEVAITGKLAVNFRDKVNKEYIPNMALLGAEKSSALDLLKDRFSLDRTLVYVCENKTCLRPFSSVGEAINAIKEVK
ncbi:MAG TPA: thioredoxin domain-containing protein, partial [Bacteroidia bacterium]|nr:thioredoxin domain-containing protein [Bacteroidia bacterium]